jgi:hypothetical protein
MPGTVKTSSTVAIDTVPLPEKIARGKLTKVRETYVLTVGGKRYPLPVGTLMDAGVKKLAGKDVAVAFSAKKPGSVVAIGTWPTPERTGIRQKAPCYWWVCYVPAPDVIRPIQEKIRFELIDVMVRSGVLSRRMGVELKGGVQAPATHI